MNTNLFGIENFNVIQDDEYYYVFRALNTADHEDIINEFLEHNRDLSRIRTDILSISSFIYIYKFYSF